MTFGRTVSRCHVCRSECVSGCVPKYVCTECKKLGHLDSLDCSKCDREYLAGVVDGLLERISLLEEYVRATEHWKLEPPDQKERAAWIAHRLEKPIKKSESGPSETGRAT